MRRFRCPRISPDSGMRLVSLRHRYRTPRTIGGMLPQPLCRTTLIRTGSKIVSAVYVSVVAQASAQPTCDPTSRPAVTTTCIEPLAAARPRSAPDIADLEWVARLLAVGSGILPDSDRRCTVERTITDPLAPFTCCIANSCRRRVLRQGRGGEDRQHWPVFVGKIRHLA